MMPGAARVAALFHDLGDQDLGDGRQHQHQHGAEDGHRQRGGGPPGIIQDELEDALENGHAVTKKPRNAGDARKMLRVPPFLC